MRKRILWGVVPVMIGAAALVVAGAALGKTGPTKRSGVTVLPSSSCGTVSYKGSGSPQFLIASDLPLQGANRSQTVQMGKAIDFILQGRGYKAGKYTIGYQACDDSTAQAGKWDAAKCSANGRSYANDRSVIGVIGTFNSGCAKLIIPLLNRAPGGPLAMVSPANTAIELTKALPPLTGPGEPGVYYPTGKRNYARVVASDDFQAPAVAIFTQKNLKKKSVYVLTDNETYGLGVAKAYQRAAKKLGLKLMGFEAWDAKASSYEALAAKINETGAEAVFLGGIVCNNGPKLLADLKAGLGKGVAILGPDGWTPFSANGAGGVGMYISVAGPPSRSLGPVGKKFVRDFTKFQGRAPDVYAVYAAQAAVVLLDAIGRSNGSRPSVVGEVFKTKIKDGILGTFAIDKNGDTTLKGITIYKQLDAKGKTIDVAGIFPPTSLTK